MNFGGFRGLAGTFFRHNMRSVPMQLTAKMKKQTYLGNAMQLQALSQTMPINNMLLLKNMREMVLRSMAEPSDELSKMFNEELMRLIKSIRSLIRCIHGSPPT